MRSASSRWFCWGGPIDRGECHFLNADGETTVTTTVTP